MLALIACSDDPESEPSLSPDFSIRSSTLLDVEETFDNGWIKYARRLFFDGRTRSEFEYYENGYIKTATVYSDYPEYHKYMEVSRDINNKPIVSTYYNADGSIDARFEYIDGLLSMKTVNADNGTTITSFKNGQISKSTFTSSDQTYVTSVVFNTNSREITTTKSGEIIHNAILLLETLLGEGADSFTNLSMSNPFPEQEQNSANILMSYSESLDWEERIYPTQYIPEYKLYKSSQYLSQPFQTNVAVSTDAYREIIEQFPTSEDQVLIAGSLFVKEQQSLVISFETRETVKNQKNDDIEAFKSKFGNEYNHIAYTGKYLYTIGVLRNLPNDPQLRYQLKQIAYNKARHLTSGTSNISKEEQALLDRVFFELKIFTSAMDDLRGKTIESFADYEQVVQELEASESKIVQREYQTFDHL